MNKYDRAAFEGLVRGALFALSKINPELFTDKPYFELRRFQQDDGNRHVYNATGYISAGGQVQLFDCKVTRLNGWRILGRSDYGVSKFLLEEVTAPGTTVTISGKAYGDGTFDVSIGISRLDESGCRIEEPAMDAFVSTGRDGKPYLLLYM